jgi:tetratricopeptide (TPR) repeat protein
MGEDLDIRSLWDFQDPAGSEGKFRGLLPGYASDSEIYVELLSQIGRTHSLRRQFVETDSVLDQAEALLKPGMWRARVRCLLERGRTRNSAGDRGAALPLFESAYRIATENQLAFLAVDAAHMIAIAHPDPDQQLEWNFRTIKLAESSEDPSVRGWLGTLYNNVGWTYYDKGDFKRSLEYLEKAKSQYYLGKNEKYKFIARWAVAKLLRLNQQAGEALPIQEALLADMESRKDIDGFVYEELGELSLAAGERGQAREYFAKAYLSLKDVAWLTESEPGRVERIRKLGIQEAS